MTGHITAGEFLAGLETGVPRSQAEQPVPRTYDSAIERFRCAVYACQLSGFACARRYRAVAEAPGALADVSKRLCHGCPAGAARARLIPGDAKAPPVELITLEKTKTPPAKAPAVHPPPPAREEEAPMNATKEKSEPARAPCPGHDGNGCPKGVTPRRAASTWCRACSAKRAAGVQRAKRKAEKLAAELAEKAAPPAAPPAPPAAPLPTCAGYTAAAVPCEAHVGHPGERCGSCAERQANLDRAVEEYARGAAGSNRQTGPAPTEGVSELFDASMWFPDGGPGRAHEFFVAGPRGLSEIQAGYQEELEDSTLRVVREFAAQAADFAYQLRHGARPVGAEVPPAVIELCEVAGDLAEARLALRLAECGERRAAEVVRRYGVEL